MATVKTSGLYNQYHNENNDYNAGNKLSQFLNCEGDAVNYAIFSIGNVLDSLDTLGSDILSQVYGESETNGGLVSVADDGKSATGYDNELYLEFTGKNLGALQAGGKGSATLTSLTVSGGDFGGSELTLNGLLVVNAKGVPSGSITSASFDDGDGTVVELGGKITVKGSITDDVVSATYTAAFSTASIDNGAGKSVSLTGKFTVLDSVEESRVVAGVGGAVSSLTFAQGDFTQLHVTGIKDLDLADLLDGDFSFDEILSGNDTISVQYTGRNYNEDDVSATIEGFAGNDTLTGGIGDDTLIGDSGNDTLRGGDGDDELIGDSLGHQVWEVQLVGEAPSKEKLPTFNDTLIGGNGDDELIGGLGNDRMTGGNGDDFYQVDSAKDVVTEGAGKGSGDDTVALLVSEDFHVYKMAANVEDVYVEDMYYRKLDSEQGYTDVTITGNALNNSIGGGYGSDTLSGGAGNDVIMGDDYYYGESEYGGDDILKGDAGSDALNGGAGVNTLTGGAGADMFVHDVYGYGDDIITDFKSGTDKLVLDFGRYQLSSDIDALDRSGTVTLSNSDYYADRDESAVMAEKLASLVTVENFELGAPGVADDASGIYFDSVDGEVWYVEYDSDMVDSSAYLMATLSGVVSLTSSDIVLVGGSEYQDVSAA